MKLCLNNPIQSTSAHQTKTALVMLFDTIVETDNLWKVLICNSPYDEIVLECIEELCDDFKIILENCMRDGGNKWLKSGLVKMNAEANVGDSWYEAK